MATQEVGINIFKAQPSFFLTYASKKHILTLSSHISDTPHIPSPSLTREPLL
jgi:hypothetical protein